jgi:hypothetical protein
MKKAKKVSWYSIRWDYDKNRYVVDPTIPALRDIAKSLKRRKFLYNKWQKINFLVGMISEIPMELWSNPECPVKSARNWIKGAKRASF